MRKMFLKILALFFVTFTSAQNINVSGNVKDNNGIPFPLWLLQGLTIRVHRVVINIGLTTKKQGRTVYSNRCYY